MLPPPRYEVAFFGVRVNFSDETAVLAWAACLLPQYLYFALGVCSDLSSYLGISVLTI